MQRVECRVCGTFNYGERIFCTKCRSRLPSDVDHVNPTEKPNGFNVVRNFIHRSSIKYVRPILLVTSVLIGIALLFRLAGFEVSGPIFESEVPTSMSSTYDIGWRNIQRDSKHSGFAQTDVSMTESVVQWSFETKSDQFTAPIVSDGIVYMGTYSGNLMALELRSGAVIWLLATGSPIDSAPAMNKSKVIVASREGTIYCLNRGTGSLHWKFSTDSPIYAPLTIHNEWVFAGGLDGHIYALDIETGDQLWRYGGSGSLVSGIAVDGNVVVASYNDNYLRILDRNEGKFRFKYFNTAGNEGTSIASGKIYLAGRDGRVRAIDSSEKEAFYDKVVRWSQVQSFAWGWRHTMPHQRGYIWSYHLPRSKFIGFPAIKGNGLFAVAMEGDMISLDRKQGKEKWRFKTSNPEIRFTTSPVLIGDWAVAGDSEGTLYWIDQETGAIALKQNYGTDPINNIAFAEGVLLINSSNGNLSGSY
ncbi:PQQ-binding-like beta-propeller repeat protein [Dehalococcoidia bacterium]|nr:PQQ-binding-like beta-propeller repeat protein [Dehalococcoidia bacterium]